jgi:tetratricopeptide (TPR) repeat protein
LNYYAPNTIISNNYYNPYYASFASTNSGLADYAQPVVINNYLVDNNTPPSDPSNRESENPSSDFSTNPPDPQMSFGFDAFDRGLDAFRNGDYAAAIKEFDLALSKLPKDPVIHETKALALFAIGEYAKSAAILNALLPSAPGMDWTSMSSLYANVDDYTQQLRNLEQYCRTHRQEAAPVFVLAYHYLVTGSKESAIKALKVVTTLEPKDLTAKRMLEGLQGIDPSKETTDGGVSSDRSREELPAPPPDSTGDSSKAPPSANKDDSTTDLVGKWSAVSPDATIRFEVDDESRFRWQVIQADKIVAELSGDLITDSDSIQLVSSEQGTLAGKVVSQGKDAWTFVPPASDNAKSPPGITFKRN